MASAGLVSYSSCLHKSANWHPIAKVVAEISCGYRKARQVRVCFSQCIALQSVFHCHSLPFACFAWQLKRPGLRRRKKCNNAIVVQIRNTRYTTVGIRPWWNLACLGCHLPVVAMPRDGPPQQTADLSCFTPSLLSKAVLRQAVSIKRCSKTEGKSQNSSIR